MITGMVSVTFRKLSPAEIIDLVRRAGLQAIEWGGDFHVPHGEIKRAREVGEMTREAGLQNLCYGSYFRLGGNGAEGLSFSSVLETAVALGTPSIRIWSGDQGSSDASSDYFERLATESLALAEKAAQAGVILCYEFHSNSLTDSAESAEKLLQAARHPNLKILWQPPNGMDPFLAVAGLKKLLPKIHHLHVFHWWPTHKERHCLEEGAINWDLYLDAVQKEHQSMPLLLEFVKNDSPDQFLADAEILKSWILR